MRTVAHKRSSWFSSKLTRKKKKKEKKKKKKKPSSSVRGKRHTTRVPCDVRNPVKDIMMMKRCHMPTCVEAMLSSGEILRRAILYIGLMTWCHKSLHLETIPS